MLPRGKHLHWTVKNPHPNVHSAFIAGGHVRPRSSPPSMQPFPTPTTITIAAPPGRRAVSLAMSLRAFDLASLSVSQLRDVRELEDGWGLGRLRLRMDS